MKYATLPAPIGTSVNEGRERLSPKSKVQVSHSVGTNRENNGMRWAGLAFIGSAVVIAAGRLATIEFPGHHLIVAGLALLALLAFATDRLRRQPPLGARKLAPAKPLGWSDLV
jgi:hypothetical protein